MTLGHPVELLLLLRRKQRSHCVAAACAYDSEFRHCGTIAGEQDPHCLLVERLRSHQPVHRFERRLRLLEIRTRLLAPGFRDALCLGKLCITQTKLIRAEIDGRRPDLMPVEFRLLQALVRHPERAYRRDEPLDLIYDDYREVSDRTIDSHVKNLRRKIDAALPNQQVLDSVYGVGYKLEFE